MAARGVWPLVVGCILALASPTQAGEPVRIELKDGRVFEGRLVSEGADAVVVEVKSGSIVGQLTIPRRDVKASTGLAKPDDPAASDRAARLAAARAQADPAARAQALLRLAEAEQDPAAAAPLHAEVAAAAPALADQEEVAAARAWLAAGRLDECEAALGRALSRNPKNAQAAALSRELSAGYAAKADELITPGVKAWSEDDPKRALRLFVRAVEALPKRVLDEASARLQESTGLGLAQLMVDCRMRSACQRCDGAGVVECPAASSAAGTRCQLGRRTTVLRTEVIAGEEVAQKDRCARCEGLGHLTCEECNGFGLALARPTAYEREALAAVLQGELQGVEARVSALLPKAEDAGAGEAVRSATVTELVTALQRMRGLAGTLAKLDPRAAAIGGGDLRRNERQMSERLSTILNAVSGTLYVLGEKRYEDALSEEEEVPAAVRSVRARQAWEIVNQARAYTAEALALSPGGAGLLGGDLKRRLSLMDQFLKRTWRTYVSLRLAEDHVRSRDALILEAFKRAVDAKIADGLGLGGAGEGRGRTEQKLKGTVDASSASSGNGNGSGGGPGGGGGSTGSRVDGGGSGSSTSNGRVNK